MQLVHFVGEIIFRKYSFPHVSDGIFEISARQTSRKKSEILNEKSDKMISVLDIKSIKVKNKVQKCVVCYVNCA